MNVIGFVSQNVVRYACLSHMKVLTLKSSIKLF